MKLSDAISQALKNPKTRAQILKQNLLMQRFYEIGLQREWKRNQLLTDNFEDRYIDERVSK